MAVAPADFLDRNLGAPYLGMFVAAILYGVTSLQTFMFFRSHRGDGPYLRATIAMLWIGDTVHTALNAHTLYYYLVSNFGDLIALVAPTSSILVQIYITACSDVTVRLVFSRRIFLLLRDRKSLAITLLLIINGLSIASAVSAFAFASMGFDFQTFFQFHEISWVFYAGFACSGAADLLIAVLLSTLLIRSRTGLRRTDSMISFLVALAINTGLLTSLCAFGCLVTYALWPDDLIFFAVYIPLSKLYFNALLASLNTRGVVRSIGYGTSVNDTSVAGPVQFRTKEVTQISIEPPIRTHIKEASV